jgi:hypothetical protein
MCFLPEDDPAVLKHIGLESNRLCHKFILVYAVVGSLCDYINLNIFGASKVLHRTRLVT